VRLFDIYENEIFNWPEWNLAMYLTDNDISYAQRL
jgi:hypothetical protein